MLVSTRFAAGLVSWFLLASCVSDNDGGEDTASLADEAVAGEDGNDDATSTDLSAEDKIEADAVAIDELQSTSVTDEAPAQGVGANTAESALDTEAASGLAPETIVSDIPQQEPETPSENVADDQASADSAPSTEIAASTDPNPSTNSDLSAESTTNEIPSEESAKEPALDTVKNGSEISETTADSGTNFGQYVVRPGDTLSKIASRLFGTPKAVEQLVATNQIGNPNLIFPGDVLRFSRTDSSVAEESANNIPNPKSHTVVVKRGDNLSKIALELFGDSASWRYLWRLNQSQIADPDRLAEGATLTLVYPEEAAAVSKGH